MQKSEEELIEQLEREMEEEHKLLQSLMEIEAKIKQLDQQTKKNKKELKNIEKSNTWKYSAPVRKLNSMFHISPEEAQHAEILAEIDMLKEEMEYVKEQLEKQNHAKTFKKLKQAKESGEIFRSLDDLLTKKQENDRYYTKALKYIASLYKNEKADYRNLVYNKLLRGMSIDTIPEIMMRAAESDSSVQLEQVSSFQASLNLRLSRRQLGELLPEYLLDKKEHAYSFIDMLGVKRPWTSEETYKISEIPQKKEIVIKPVDGAGSRGVYLVLDDNNIFDIKRQETLESWGNLIENMNQDIASGWVNQDEWFIEELIYNEEKKSANDIKFYCFYGKVALILEITRYPELKYCFWTAKGERIRTGKYDEFLYKGKGISQSEIELASTISEKIPAPFIRIDFLRSINGLVFGEFTPKPGNYDEFDRKTDQLLGDYYLEAEGLLMSDLLNGKQFTQYRELKDMLNK